MQPGNAFAYEFSTIGEYPYYDALNPNWTGRIVVVPPEVVNDSPTVTILTPTDSIIVPVGTITVTGWVTDTNAIVFVEVNGITATLTGNQFKVEIPVVAGAQAIHATAEDEMGASGTASRIVQADGAGPEITITAPNHNQAVYTTQPTIEATFDDFLSNVSTAGFNATLTDEGGAVQDVSGDLTVTTTSAQGTLTTALAQDAVYTLTLTLQDSLSNFSTVQSVFYVTANPGAIVPPPLPDPAGWISGRVYDSTNCNDYLTTCEGLAGVYVTLEQIEPTAVAQARAERQQAIQSQLARGVTLPLLPPSTAIAANTLLTGTVVTGPDGFFAFPVADTAIYWLRAEKDGYTYGQREAEIVKERSTATSNIYLTPLDPLVTTCPDTGCTHINSNGSMQLIVPPGAIPTGETRDLSATVFEQVEFLPSGELPPGTWETYAFNLGGASEITFTVPITVRQLNTRGFAPDTQIPLGYWNQNTLEWEHAGTGVVDPTGQWVEMEVIHFSNYDCNDPLAPPDIEPEPTPGEEEPPCAAGEEGCFINVQSGQFEEWVTLSAVEIFNQSVAPQLRFSTERAHPSAVIDINLNLNALNTVQIGDTIQWQLFIEGQQTDNFTFVLSDTQQAGRFRYYWNGQNALGERLPSGIYEYTVILGIPYTGEYCYALGGIFGNPPDCVNGATGVFADAVKDIVVRGTVALEGTPEAPFGTGWVLDGQQRLVDDEDGRILVADGRRRDEFYFPFRDLIVQQSPLDELPLVWVNNGVSFYNSSRNESLQFLPESVARTWEGKEVQVGSEPAGVFITEDGTTAYVANRQSGTVSVVDVINGVATATIAVGPQPRALVSPSGSNLLYVATAQGSTIKVVDLDENVLTDTITVGATPYHFVLASDNNIAYVVNRDSDTMSVVDLAGAQTVATIPAGDRPIFIALTADESYAYVISDFPAALSIVNLTTQTLSETIPIGGLTLRQIALSQDGTEAYITRNSDSILVFDIATEQTIDTIGDFDGPNGIVLAADGQTAYVGDHGNGIAVVDLPSRTIGETYRTCNYPSGIALSANEGYAYIACQFDNKFRTIPLAQQQTTVTTHDLFYRPEAVALSYDASTAYVVTDGFAADRLHILDMATGNVTAEIYTSNGGVSDIVLSADQRYAYVPVGFGVDIFDLANQSLLTTISTVAYPQAVAVSPDGTQLYIAETGTNALVIADLFSFTIIATIPVGSDPQDVVVTADGQFAYLSNYDDGTVSVVNIPLQSVVATIPVGTRPIGIALTLDENLAYVANSQSGTVSVIDLDTNMVVSTITGLSRVRHIVITEDGTTAYIGTERGVYVLNIETNNITGVISNDTDPVYFLALPPTGTDTIFSRTNTDFSSLNWDEDSQTYRRAYQDGTIVQFTPEGWHDKTIDRTGRETRYTYDSEGRVLTKSIVAPGESTPDWTWTFAYSNGYLSAITDPGGRVTTLTVNDANQLSNVVLPDGSAHAYTYTEDDLLTHHTNPNGEIVEQVYDEYGRIEQLIEPLRPIYDQSTGMVSTTQETLTFTPSDTHFGLINERTPGDPANPGPAAPPNDTVIDSVEYGRGSVSGHTNVYGNWLDRTDALGRTTYYEYDNANNLTGITTPDNDCQKMTYDGAGHITELIEGENDNCDSGGDRLWTYTYEGRFDQLKNVTDPNYNTTTYIYDYEENVGDVGNLIRIVYPSVPDENGSYVEAEESFTYNAFGQLETMTDARGVVTRYVYTQGIPDEAGTGATPLFLPGVTPVPGILTRVIEDEDGFDYTTTYRDFNGAGVPTQIIQPGGLNTIDIEYDGYNRITRQTDAVGIVTTFAYDDKGNLIEKVVDYTADGTTGRNVVTTYTYNSDNLPILERTEDDGLIVQQRWDYDVNGKVGLKEDGRGYQTRYTYDDSDQLLSMTDAAGYTTSYTYTPDGRVATMTDGEGTVTRYTYDSGGRILTEVKDEGGLNLTTSYEYDTLGNLYSKTDPDGTVTCYYYDGLQRRTDEIRDCGGLELYTTYYYTLNGDPAGQRDPRGIYTQHQRDALGRLTTEIQDADGLALTTNYTYDGAGNLTTVTDPRGTVSSYTYDALNRMTARCGDSAGVNSCTTFTYDRLNLPASTTDPNGVVSLITHNAWGKKTTVTEDAGGLDALTTYQYDETLNLIAVTDANGNETRYTYGPRNDTTNHQYANGSVIGYSWDGRGALLSTTHQDGLAITYSYDSGGRLVGKVIGTEGTQTIGYDEMGRVTFAGQTMAGHTTIVTLDHDPFGNATEEIQSVDGLTWTVGYAYDYVTGILTTTYPSGAVRELELDSVNRLTTIKNEVNSPIATYDYDPALTYDRVTYPNGIVTQRDFDPLNRITRVSSAVADYQYGYDNADHRLYQQRLHQPNQPADVVVYDALYRPIQVWYGANSTTPGTITTQTSEREYEVDPLRNWLTVTTDGVPTTYGPNDGQQLLNSVNQYENVGVDALTYDAKGNLVTDGLNGYSYNGLNQLIGVDGIADDGEYIYNALGSRVAKIVDGITTYFVYDTGKRVLEERSVADELLARYTYTISTDDIVMMERGGTSYYYHKDAQGNITEVTDSLGGVVERYEYDIYGTVIRFNGSGTPIPTTLIGNYYLYTGRYYDAESGLYEFRARAYSPRLGRFVQQDPIGYVDGLNLYASYFAINTTDPMGTSPNFNVPPGVEIQGPSVDEVELASVSSYTGLGGGVSVTASGEEEDCCLNQELITDGMKTNTINVKLSVGVGAGGSAKVGGVGIELSVTGPQIFETISFSVKTTTCGGPFSTFQSCKTEGIDFGKTMSAGAGPVSISGGISVSGFWKLCTQSDPSGHGSVTSSACGNATMSVGYGLGPASGNAISGSSGDVCKTFTATF